MTNRLDVGNVKTSDLLERKVKYNTKEDRIKVQLDGIKKILTNSLIEEMRNKLMKSRGLEEGPKATLSLHMHYQGSIVYIEPMWFLDDGRGITKTVEFKCKNNYNTLCFKFSEEEGLTILYRCDQGEYQRPKAIESESSELLKSIKNIEDVKTFIKEVKIEISTEGLLRCNTSRLRGGNRPRIPFKAGIVLGDIISREESNKINKEAQLLKNVSTYERKISDLTNKQLELNTKRYMSSEMKKEYGKTIEDKIKEFQDLLVKAELALLENLIGSVESPDFKMSNASPVGIEATEILYVDKGFNTMEFHSEYFSRKEATAGISDRLEQNAGTGAYSSWFGSINSSGGV